MNSQEMIETIEAIENTVFDEDFILDDLPGIIEEDFPEIKDYAAKLFTLTGERDKVAVTVDQINELRKFGTLILRQDLGDFWFVILEDDLLQKICIHISKIKRKPHFVCLIRNQNSVLSE